LALDKIASAVEDGNKNDATKLVSEAIEKGTPVQEILDALIKGMGVVGDLFKNEEIFIPELIMSANAMTAGIKLLEPLMAKADIKPIGTVVIGTIQGDLHEIGKNLVAIMMRGVGAIVHDLGIDVSPQKFLDKAKEVNADIVAISTMLTTTAPVMGDVVDFFVKNGYRDKVWFLVGGSPISVAYAKEIGADCYAPDAGSAADVTLNYLKSKNA